MGFQSFLQSTPLEMIHSVIDRLDSISGQLGIRSMILYVTVAVWFAILGLAGMQLAKLYAAVGFAGIGFYVGCLGFEMLSAKVAAVAMLPHFTGYAVGLLLAFILFALAWRFCVPTIYLCYIAVGYFLASLITTNLWVCIGLGVLLAILASFCFVFLFIALTSCVAGFGVTAMLGAMYPNVAALQLGPNSLAVWVAIAIAAVFLVFQCLTTRTYRKFGF